jgi:hypothetical protein
MKSKKLSVSEKIMKVITESPKDAEQIKIELKDKFGFSEKLDDIRVNLLYLLRREDIKRQKDAKIYRYHI